LFLTLSILIGVAFVLLAGFGWATYPHLSAVARAYGPGHGIEAFAAWHEAQKEWFANLKDVGQLFVVTPLLPLLGTVLGYTFGRREAPSNNERE
jgi:hypothetical protein